MRMTPPAGDPWFMRPGRHVLHYNDFVSHREELYALLREGRITVDVDWNQGTRGAESMDAFVYVVEVVGCST